jgi:hypothetical protein
LSQETQIKAASENVKQLKTIHMKTIFKSIALFTLFATNTIFAQQMSVTTQITNPSCNSVGDGEIRIIFTGGIQPYFVNGEEVNGSMYTISNLFKGEYEYTVSDNAQSAQDVFVPLTAPLAVPIPGVVTHLSSLGANNGAIDITIPVPIIAINWFTADGSGLQADQEDQTGLSTGLYAVTITEPNGCESSMRFQVNVNPAVGPGPTFPSFEPNIDIATGVNTSGMIVYPNPSTGKFKIESKENNSKINSITVVNEAGRVIERHQMNNALELELLPGIYFIHASDESGQTSIERISIR